MTGDELRELRTRLGWSQNRMGTILRDAGQPGARSSVREWETGKTRVPPGVVAFMEAVAADLDEGLIAPDPPPARGRRPGGDPPPPPADTPPPLPDGQVSQPQTPLFTSAAYAKTCEQLFELIATGVGMVGAAIGSEAVKKDGLSIFEDKEALGAAYGKLAETNEVFRNILMSSDRQGAYLAVALATGTTAGKIWRNHADAPKRIPQMDAVEVLEHDVAAAGQ